VAILSEEKIRVERLKKFRLSLGLRVPFLNYNIVHQSPDAIGLLYKLTPQISG
jgi:hypothetical protein